MKTYRKFLFAFGKAIKYCFWGLSALFFYHLLLVKYKEKPEEGFGANGMLLDFAFGAKFAYEDLVKLITKPPVDCLLPQRLMEPPPGAMIPKTLVLNLNGTLIHSEYKFGVGFEVLKRPGLSVFLQRMARSYECVIFGD